MSVSVAVVSQVWGVFVFTLLFLCICSSHRGVRLLVQPCLVLPQSISLPSWDAFRSFLSAACSLSSPPSKSSTQPSSLLYHLAAVFFSQGAQVCISGRGRLSSLHTLALTAGRPIVHTVCVETCRREGIM